jgi:micrococcal nuclease
MPEPRVCRVCNAACAASLPVIASPPMPRAPALTRSAAAAAVAIAVATVTTFVHTGDEPAATPALGIALVLRVIDGDTIVVRMGGRVERVRYIGVDTPETRHGDSRAECFAARAADANRALVVGRRVRLAGDRRRRDRYGRLLAYVFDDRGRSVNALLVRDGYARTLAIAPDTTHAGTFARLAAGARADGRGLWGACD